MAFRYVADTVAFIGWLTFRSPMLLPALQEHLEDNEGEVLPHVVLFRIRQWVESEIQGGGDLRAVSGVIESLQVGRKGASADVQNLIQVSFIDDLSLAPHPAAYLRELLETDAE